MRRLQGWFYEECKQNKAQEKYDRWEKAAKDYQTKIGEIYTQMKQKERVIPPGTASSSKTQWQYLECRPHSWRQQLYLKGKRIKASVIYSDMIVNEETPEEAAENWDLPLAAIEEVIDYCETHQELLKQEALEGRRRLEEKGVSLEPKVAC